MANQGGNVGPFQGETTMVFDIEITNIGGGHNTGKVTLMITVVKYIFMTFKQAVLLLVAPG